MLKRKLKGYLIFSIVALVLLSTSTSILLAKEIIFQNGLNYYNGTQDTWIDGSGAIRKDYNYGGSETLEAIGMPHSGTKKNPLIRFDDIIGDDENQIPEHAQINSARFELYQYETTWTSGSRSINLQKMLVPWTAGTSDGAIEEGVVTYNYRVHSDTDPVPWGGTGKDGPARSGVDYTSAGVSYALTEKTYQDIDWKGFDISNLFSEWVAGEPNYGMLISCNTGYMGASYRSSEYSEDPSLRPRLIVNYTAVDKDASEFSISHTQTPAGGDDYPVAVTVRVLDEAGIPIPDVKVDLEKSLGPDINIEAKNQGKTNSSGFAEFTVTSTKGGLVKLYPVIEHGERKNVSLENKERTIDFKQAVNQRNSGIIFGADAVSADRESKNLTTVKLVDYEGEAIVNRKVILSSPSPEKVDIKQSEIRTNANGEAIFELVSASNSLEPIYARLNAQVEPDLAGGDNLSFISVVEFTGRLLTQQDGDNFSEVIVERKLPIGLKEEHVGENIVPNDGISYWEIKAKLLDNSGAVENRRVMVSVQGGQELGEDELYPREAWTDADGEAKFYLKTTKNISEVDLKIQVPNDEGGSWLQKLKFSTAEQLLYITEVFPAKDSNESDVTQDFEFAFNSNVKLISGRSSIRLIPVSGNGNGKEVFDTYNGTDDGLWLVSGNKVIWKHKRLMQNILYEAELEGVAVQTDSSILMKPFVWRFVAIDSIPPSVTSVAPLPWEVGVSREAVLKLVFSEELPIDEKTGIPLGLILEINDNNNKALPNNKIEFLSYDQNTSVAMFKLSLEGGTTYNTSVRGVLDYADLEMLPFSSSFSTINTGPPSVANITYSRNVIGGITVTSPVNVFFNKQIKQSAAPEVVIINNLDENEVISGRTQFVSGLEGIAITFIPDHAFAYDTVYRITFNNVFDNEEQPYSGKDILFITEARSSESKPIEGGKTYVFDIKQEDGNDLIAEANIPKHAITPDSQMQIYMAHTNRYEEFDFGKYNPNLALTPFIFEVVNLHEEKSLMKLNKPITIKLPYIDVDNKADGTGKVLDIRGNSISESSIKVYYWEDFKKEWLPLGGNVDYIANRAIFETDILGTFALIGSSISVEEILSEVRITTNPLSIKEIPERKQTTIKFRTAYDCNVTIALFDSSGRMLGNIIKDKPFNGGYNGLIWDGTINGIPLKPGAYIYRLSVTSTSPSQNDNAWVSGVIGVAR